MTKYARDQNRLHDLWSPNTVLGYWRTHKGDHPVKGASCPTKKCRVFQIMPYDIQVMVSFEGKTFLALNIYKIPLYEGDIVLVHNNCIAEKEMLGV